MFRHKKNNKDRLSKILDRYANVSDPIAATNSFVKEFLNPTPDRYDTTYRYEHSLRVALWGKRIAEGEGWNSEPLVMACLLHDVGYPECKSIKDLKNHPEYSTAIAEKFLKKIQYDEGLSKSICKAVAIHDKWNNVPEDATPFELSVRDADDLDRFDIMRMCMLGNGDIGERSANELIELCDKRLASLEESKNRICGTLTAKKLWEQELQTRKQFYESLKSQMHGTFEMEKWLLEL